MANATTISRFPLLIRGLPYLLYKPGIGTNVQGEVYRVPISGIRECLDELEGHPFWYYRDRISVVSEKGPLRVWAYFLRVPPDGWQRMSMHTRFQ